MDKYHVGIRLRGFSKSFFKVQKAKSEQNDEKYVPHITLLRPFYANNEKELIEVFYQTLNQYKDPIKFNITDFGYFDNSKKIIKGEIDYNPQIENIIHSLENNLEKIIKFENEKPEDKINLHVTISEQNDLSIMKYLDNQILPIEQYLLRIYLLKHNQNPKQKLILNEYDFYLENHLLSREEAKDKELFRQTIKNFQMQTGLKSSSKGFIQI